MICVTDARHLHCERTYRLRGEPQQDECLNCACPDRGFIAPILQSGKRSMPMISTEWTGVSGVALLATFRPLGCPRLGGARFSFEVCKGGTEFARYQTVVI